MTPAPQAARPAAEGATRHTPGPWTLCAHLETPPTDCECGYRGAIWSGSADQMICEMGPHGQGWEMVPQPSMETHRANARLIAAAPDMLAYCRLMAANGDPDAIELVAKATQP